MYYQQPNKWVLLWARFRVFIVQKWMQNARTIKVKAALNALTVQNNKKVLHLKSQDNVYKIVLWNHMKERNFVIGVMKHASNAMGVKITIALSARRDIYKTQLLHIHYPKNASRLAQLKPIQVLIVSVWNVIDKRGNILIILVGNAKFAIQKS